MIGIRLITCSISISVNVQLVLLDYITFIYTYIIGIRIFSFKVLNFYLYCMFYVINAIADPKYVI